MRTEMRKRIVIAIVVFIMLPALSLAQKPCKPAAFPSFSFTSDNIFPSDKSLKRPEDGAALRDGRIVVGDEEHGLRVVDKSGKHRPFGRFAKAGYRNAPPEKPGAPNGVHIEPNGKYLLVSDVYTGVIYRVDIKDRRKPEVIYRHEYGVNSIVREPNGTIWFTQSAENNLSTGSDALYAAINKPVRDPEQYSGFPVPGGILKGRRRKSIGWSAFGKW